MGDEFVHPAQRPMVMIARANNFFIGIELTSIHPDDDARIRTKLEPAYTEAQYRALGLLLTQLVSQHPIAKIVGHDEIAPDRKKDSGSQFDWSRVRDADKAPLLAE